MFGEEAGPPISGDAFSQNRQLVALLRDVIQKLDSNGKRGGMSGSAVLQLSDWIEGEVSIIVT